MTLEDTLLKPGEVESMAAEYGPRIPEDVWRLVERIRQKRATAAPADPEHSQQEKIYAQS